jgi:hypothetical protein
MKKVLMLALALTMCASMAFAAVGGLIGVYSDAAGTNCGYTPAFGIANIFVVHTAIPAATASQFKVDYSAVLDPYISETLAPGLLGLGTSGAGIGVSYAGCKNTPLLLLTLTFFDQNLTPACTPVTVVPDPAAPTGTIEVVDCNTVKVLGDGGTMWWNGDASCGDCFPTATETKSWGKIKALYN